MSENSDKIRIGEYYTVDGQRWKVIGKDDSNIDSWILEKPRQNLSSIRIIRTARQIIDGDADAHVRDVELEIHRSGYGRTIRQNCMVRRGR